MHNCCPLTRDTLAVFDSRYGEEIMKWLTEHTEIKLVTKDESQSYAYIITAAPPDIVHVSDRFHLTKNLKETAVDLVRDFLGKKKQKIEYNREGIATLRTKMIFQKQNTSTKILYLN